jgi:hypothetical protein
MSVFLERGGWLFLMRWRNQPLALLSLRHRRRNWENRRSWQQYVAGSKEVLSLNENRVCQPAFARALCLIHGVSSENSYMDRIPYVVLSTKSLSRYRNKATDCTCLEIKAVFLAELTKVAVFHNVQEGFATVLFTRYRTLFFWILSSTTIQRQTEESVELYLHFPDHFLAWG